MAKPAENSDTNLGSALDAPHRICGENPKIPVPRNRFWRCHEANLIKIRSKSPLLFPPLLGCHPSEMFGSSAQMDQQLLSPRLVPYKMLFLFFFFLLKTPRFSLDTAPWDEQGVQERDPRPENLLSPTFHFLEVRKLNLGAWKLLPLSRNPGDFLGRRSRLESKEAAQVWDGGSGISAVIQLCHSQVYGNSFIFIYFWEHSQGLGAVLTPQGDPGVLWLILQSSGFPAGWSSSLGTPQG